MEIAMNTPIHIGFGIFMWSGPERRTARYGHVYMSEKNFNEDVTARPFLNADALRSLEGQKVRIVCRVVESRQSGHAGDKFIGIAPSQPLTGEQIVLGVGYLSLDKDEYAYGGMAFGFKPSDGRVRYWLDPNILYRLHDQTVDVFIEPSDEDESPAPKVTEKAQRGAISNGDGTFQARIPAGRTSIRLKPKIEPLGGGMFSLTPPTAHGNEGEFIESD